MKIESLFRIPLSYVFLVSRYCSECYSEAYMLRVYHFVLCSITLVFALLCVRITQSPLRECHCRDSADLPITAHHLPVYPFDDVIGGLAVWQNVAT